MYYSPVPERGQRLTGQQSRDPRYDGKGGDQADQHIGHQSIAFVLEEAEAQQQN